MQTQFPCILVCIGVVKRDRMFLLHGWSMRKQVVFEVHFCGKPQKLSKLRKNVKVLHENVREKDMVIKKFYYLFMLQL